MEKRRSDRIGLKSEQVQWPDGKITPLKNSYEMVGLAW
jgi:hypothetical protein